MIRNTAQLFCKGARIGYLSDVHTEFLRYPKCIQHIGSRQCDVLVLAGDIGNPFSQDGTYRKFLEACAGIAKHTLVIAGNHEYYQQKRYSMAQTKTKIASICDTISKSALANPHIGNVMFMDNSVFTYCVPETRHNIRFICSTLWSDIDKSQENLIYNSINDYNHIMEFTPGTSRRLFSAACSFINECLTPTTTDVHTTSNIVVTHHAPTTHQVSARKYDNSPLNSAFASDFKYNSKAKPPYAWIYGHTHYNMSRYDERLDTLLLSNQVGYPGEDCGLIVGQEGQEGQE